MRRLRELPVRRLFDDTVEFVEPNGENQDMSSSLSLDGLDGRGERWTFFLDDALEEAELDELRAYPQRRVSWASPQVQGALLLSLARQRDVNASGDGFVIARRRSERERGERRGTGGAR